MAEKKEQDHNLQDKWLGIPILKPPAEDTPLYHVHQKDGVLICDNFLLEGCPLQEYCPRHHTPFPYHWQWQHWKNRVWLSFSIPSQHHLERLYCSTKFTEVFLRSRKDSNKILDLDTMKILNSNFQLCHRVRRLSNSSSIAHNSYFPEKWKFYRFNDRSETEIDDEIDEWEEYSLPISEQLVAAFEKGKWNHAFYEDDYPYNVDFKELTEYNIKMGIVLPIKYRPSLRLFYYIMPYLRSVARPHHTAAVRGEDPLDLYCGPYPAAWVTPPQGDSAFTMMEVDAAEMAYYVVSKHFYSSFCTDRVIILAIYRVRNDHLWQAYVRQKNIMIQNRLLKDQRTLEQHLFHGTGAAQIKSICTMNFNPHLAGKHGALYGKGIYFSKAASYAHHYATKTEDDVRHMFLTKVLTGYRHRGRKGLKRPRRRCDSCTDTSSYPSIFVVFRSCQCYPYFVIRYKEMNTPVTIDL